MYRVPKRLYKTVDGRLVGHNDPEAAFLAFPAGMELSDEEAQRYGLVPAGEKKAPRPADKMAGRPRDKAVTKTEAKEQADA